jgi:hypothetical protein
MLQHEWPLKCYAEWEKKVTKDHMLYGPVHVKWIEWAAYKDMAAWLSETRKEEKLGREWLLMG